MINRYWTRNAASAFDTVKWASSTVTLKDYRTGNTIYHCDSVEYPEGWSANAVEICASKYFRRADIPDIGSETSVRQLANRVASCLAGHGAKRGYFSAGEDNVFRDELIAGFLNQRVGFNSPVWFNYGLFSEYGISGNGERERYYFDGEAGEIRSIRNELERPSGAACYLSGVSDSLFTEDQSGMADLLSNEQKIFLTGAGDGVNISGIRGTGEPISGGGTSSGLIAFLKVRDACAGYIRSGGRTRRSATLLCCELDHPDIMAFIEWKEAEEKKARALLSAGCSAGMDGEAYGTVSGQNSNNSVRVTNAFMEAVELDENWYLLSRVGLDKFGLKTSNLEAGGVVPQGQLWLNAGGSVVALTKNGETGARKIMGVQRAGDLWRQVCESAWRCGCPGIQFDDLINDWNTVPKYGRIMTTNPCAEICLPDWSVCNLGSLNLMQFFEDLEAPDWDGFSHAIRLMTTALDLVVDMSSYPTRKHAEGSVMLRAIGLNHGNIGAVLMRNGIAYDSDAGRMWMAAITSRMTLESYRMSLELAGKLGNYPAYDAGDHGRVLEMHRDAAVAMGDYACGGAPEAVVLEELAKEWAEFCGSEELLTMGLRNNTVTTIPPQGTIGLVLDQDTLGCEPEFCLVKHKTLSGGGSMMMVNQSVTAGLCKLGYSAGEIDQICDYVNTFSTVEGCPVLRECDLPVFDTAVKPANTLDMSLVGALRKKADRQEAIAAIADAKTREEAAAALPPHLKYLAGAIKVFRRTISIEGHVEALAAFQPHLSHSVSKTCNLDATCTVEDISDTYRLAYERGVKCVAVYRDGSKKAQPLSAGNQAGPDGSPVTGSGAAAGKWPAVKRATPHHSSNCDLFHFAIADPTSKQGLFINTSLYPDTTDLMSVFVNTGRQGETTNGLVHSLARVISCALQHGVPPEEIGHKLEGMSFPPHGFLGETSAFGIHRAKSISDLIGRLLIALPEYYASGRDAAVMHPAVAAGFESVLRNEVLSNGEDLSSDQVNAGNARTLGYSGKPCGNCGSYLTIGRAECFVCKQCGQSNGPCAG